MSDKPVTTSSQPPVEFDVIFAKIDQSGDVARTVRDITREVENINLLMQAVAEIETPHYRVTISG